jgi:hypothetical protein
MSKFIEMLEKTSESAPSPLGFGASSRRGAVNPPVVLIGQITADELDKNPKLLESEADVILLTLTSSDEKAVNGVSDALKGRLWGVRVGAISEEQAASLKEKGCDFVVFDPENTAAAVLNDDDLGKIIAVSSDLDESAGQAISGLHIDCALLSPSESLLPLTVQKLIDIEMIRGLVGKYFVMAAPSEIARAELESFKNANIAGIVVNLSSAGEISRIKKAINDLPRRKPGARSRRGLMAQAPTAGFAALSRGNEHDDDDDEDDF